MTFSSSKSEITNQIGTFPLKKQETRGKRKTSKEFFCLAFQLRTFASKSSYGEIFFISPLELVHKVLTPKMKKKVGITDFVSEKMAFILYILYHISTKGR